MTKTPTSKMNRAIFGARFSEQYDKYKNEHEGTTQTSFGKLFDPPASRGSVMKWCNGDNIPSPDRMKRICEIFGVPEDYFNTDNATHDELYEHGSAFITQIGRSHVEFAKQKGLNLDMIRLLTKVVDFDERFPLYSPIDHWTLDPEIPFNYIYDRDVNYASSAEIDDDLQFLQVTREGKRITLCRSDIAYLKEVQDKVVEYVEFLFYSRAKEMEDEVVKFNEDLHPTPNTQRIPNLQFKMDHDRFYQYCFVDEDEAKKLEDQGLGSMIDDEADRTEIKIGARKK